MLSMRKVLTTAVICALAFTSAVPLAACDEKTEPSHTHEYDGGTVIKEATCTEDGSKKVTCKICGDFVIFTIDAAHDYGSWVTDFEPGCAYEGQKSRTCNSCGDIITQPIDRMKHNYDEWVSGDDHSHERTCKTCGETDYGNHDYKNETCVLCGYEDGDTPSKDLVFKSLGEGYILASTVDEKYHRSLKIPATYRGLPVIGIDGNAFVNDRYFLESIFIPASIKYIYTGFISPNAFCACNDIKEIIVDENNEYFSSENGILFNKDKKVLYRVPQTTLQNFTLPESVTEIGAGAFYNCTQLNSITLHSKLTKIGKQAFENCRALTKLTIPESVELIDKNAFKNTNLKEVTFEYTKYTVQSFEHIVHLNASLANTLTAARCLKSEYVDYQFIKE